MLEHWKDLSNLFIIEIIVKYKTAVNVNVVMIFKFYRPFAKSYVYCLLSDFMQFCIWIFMLICCPKMTSTHKQHSEPLGCISGYPGSLGIIPFCKWMPIVPLYLPGSFVLSLTDQSPVIRFYLYLNDSFKCTCQTAKVNRHILFIMWYTDYQGIYSVNYIRFCI